MKHKLLLFALLLPFLSIAQKHDYVWVFGNRYAPGYPVESFVLDFKEEPPLIEPITTDARMWTVGISMCDSMGNLLFFSNGLKVFDADGALMENGDSLGHLPCYLRYRWEGMPHNLGNFVLPNPDGTNSYYMFHTSFGENPTGSPDRAVSYLHYCKIDMDANGGKGTVIRKNVLVQTGVGLLTAAVKHANGRDWWVISMPTFSENYSYNYFRTLITNKGVESMNWVQYDLNNNQIGSPTIIDGDLYPLAFSPDGTKLAIPLTNFWGIANFDRCIGDLSSLNRLFSFGATTFSHNSQFIYGGDLGKRIRSLMDNPTSGSWYNIEPLPINYPHIQNLDTNFIANLMLAPNKKIYGLPNLPQIWRGSKALHIIHNPDLGEMSADVEWKGLKFPYPNYNTSYHFPNYRLGKLEGSPCDTLLSLSESFIPLERDKPSKPIKNNYFTIKQPISKPEKK